MDTLQPVEIFEQILSSSEAKRAVSSERLFIRGALGGAVIAAATAVAQTVVAQGAPAFVGALVFPVGFAILSLMGFELVTGAFGLMPAAALSRRVSPGEVLRVWGVVFLGNFVGALAMAFLFAWFFMGQEAQTQVMVTTAEKKVFPYAAAGGWWLAFAKGAVCNWLVTTASVLALSSRSQFGRVAALWLPVFIFFSLALEHSVVNMYAIPAGILLGAGVSWLDWWSINLVPVLAGNLAGALIGTSLPQWRLFASPR